MSYNSSAKYTKHDYEVKKLNAEDRINYDYFLINYNVDADQDVANGVNALKSAKNPTNLLSMLRQPKQISVLVTAIIMLLLIISLIVFIIYYIWVWYKGYELKKEMMKEATLVLLGLILFISVFTWFYNFILKEIWKAYMMIPSGNTTNEYPDEE